MKNKFIAIAILFLFFISLINSGSIAAHVKETDNVTDKVTAYLKF